MTGQVSDGKYWLPGEESLDWQPVRVWYRREGLKRGWWCTPMQGDQPDELNFPVSPDVWKALKSEAEIDMLNTNRKGIREHEST